VLNGYLLCEARATACFNIGGYMSNAHDRQYTAEELEAMRKGIMLTPEE